MTDSIAGLHGHVLAVWAISLLTIACVLIRPKGISEAWWSVAGALLLVVLGLVTPVSAAHAVAKGIDVYLFLTGMMIVAELARREGVFDWIAVYAVKAANGSRARLFSLIYLVGTAVTILLSNDATAVVLTPAVQAAVKAAHAEPLPYLLICAFIANASSFVLPISNPANLVVYNGAMPPLGRWLLTFGLPSLLAIVATYFVLRLLSHQLLQGAMENNLQKKNLTLPGKLTLGGIGFLAVVLMTASAFGEPLGAPACIAAVVVATAIVLIDRKALPDITREIAWSVIPLVAGLFVVIEAINGAGAQDLVVAALQDMKSWPPAAAALSSGFGLAIASNLMNNLPSGLISGNAVRVAHATGVLRDSVLIGVDLGPNLSVTGSLATILWLIAIRREGQSVGFWTFLRYGVCVMPPALALAVLALLVR
ncbi:MAG TPA: arsenic transporter [Bryobacteraceae bacterium]|nr:arsenic transporter [Bryobacteraceae bacterium]